MLETAYLRSKPEEARTRLTKRNLDADALLPRPYWTMEHAKGCAAGGDGDQKPHHRGLMKAGKGGAEAEPAIEGPDHRS